MLLGVPKSDPPESVLAVAEQVLVLLEYPVEAYRFRLQPANQPPNPTSSAINPRNGFLNKRVG